MLLSALWICLGAISAIQIASWPEMNRNLALLFVFVDWGPWIVLSPFVVWFAGRVPIDGTNWKRTVPLHLGLGVVSIAGVQVFTDFVAVRHLGLRPPFRIRLAAPPGAPPMPLPDRPPIRLVRARFSLPIYCVLIATAHAIVYHRRSLERERRALLAESRLTAARLMALQTQLNPHFLFNTLNAISSFVYTRPAQADEMLCTLSELLRRVLDTAHRREVTLVEELGFLALYLDLQRIRFADRLEIRREIAPGLERVAVPTLLLQPLVENAIAHGIAPCTGRGTLLLSARVQGAYLELCIADTGNGRIPFPTDAGGTVHVVERIGIQNTRARLASLYGERARLALVRSPLGGLCARVTLPLHPVARA